MKALPLTSIRAGDSNYACHWTSKGANDGVAACLNSYCGGFLSDNACSIYRNGGIIPNQRDRTASAGAGGGTETHGVVDGVIRDDDLDTRLKRDVDRGAGGIYINAGGGLIWK
jgi:hypothetical protein